MKYLIQEGNIVGSIVGDSSIAMNGFEIVESDIAADIENLYYDGQIRLKPDRPDGISYWDDVNHEWVVIPTPDPEDAQPYQDWRSLESQLRNSAVWEKAYTSAEKSVKANAAFTMIMTTIATTRILDDLKFGWAKLRSTMQTQSSLEDFTIAELEYLSEALENSGFDLADFDLSGGI